MSRRLVLPTRLLRSLNREGRERLRFASAGVMTDQFNISALVGIYDTSGLLLPVWWKEYRPSEQ